MKITNKQLLGGVIIATFLFCLFGCSESKKIQKAKATLNDNPIDAAKYCAEKYPVKEIEIYKEGAVRYDTIWQTLESYVPFDCPPSDTITTYQVQVKFKEKVVTKERIDTITITKENTARYEAEKLQKEDSIKESKEWQDKAKGRGKWRNIWMLIAIGEGFWITRKLWMKLFI